MALTTHQLPRENLLLAGLPRDTRDRFFSQLQPVSLTLRESLYSAGAPIEYVYFVEQGVASVLTTMANGMTIEVGMIGSEGLVGMSVVLGGQSAVQQIVVQASGCAQRMRAWDCKAAFDDSPAVRAPFLRYVDTFLNLAAQTAACNRLHSVEQRCARWLLMACDRVQSDTIPMTHEFLAAMLGVRRAGVTETAGELQRAGLIRNHRGTVTILDRGGLEAAACECYRLDHDQLLQLAAGVG